MPFRMRTLLGVIVAVSVIVILAQVGVFSGEQWIAWCGSTDLEIEFMVIDKVTGQPIPGATLILIKDPFHYEAAFDPVRGDFILTAGPDGSAKALFKDTFSHGSSGARRDSFFAHARDFQVRVKANGYAIFYHDWPGGAVPQGKRGPPFARTTMKIALVPEKPK